MADLTQKERDALKDSDFAVPSKRELPLQDLKHARLAWDMVDRTEGLTGEEKAEARQRIKARLAELGEPLKEDDGKGAGDGRAVEAATTRNDPDAVENIFFLPITRIDQDRREVEGVATSEAVDTFGTVFDYDASKAAFQAWGGNVREMHQPKAVGRKVDVRFDDERKQIVVRARISKGAEDTWQKILDGTLSGYSIGGNKAIWTRGQDAPPRCTKYDLVELSIVDQASNPDGRGLTLYRAEGEQPDVLDDLEQPEQPTAGDNARVERPEETREGRTISAATREKLHSMRDAALGAAKSAMDACGCDDCQGMAAKGDDEDGEDDDRARLVAEVTRVVAAATDPLRRELSLLRVASLTRAPIQPDLSRFDGLAGDVGKLGDELGKLDRAMAEIKAEVTRIAEQPLPNGPVLRAMAAAADLRPADKQLPTGGAARPPANPVADEIAALERLAVASADQAVQTAVAARILSLQRAA